MMPADLPVVRRLDGLDTDLLSFLQGLEPSAVVATADSGGGPPGQELCEPRGARRRTSRRSVARRGGPKRTRPADGRSAEVMCSAPALREGL